MPVSAIATAQPVMTPSMASRSAQESGGSSATRSASDAVEPRLGDAGRDGDPARAARARTSAMTAGRVASVARWTVAR